MTEKNVSDGYTNVAANIATSRDKAAHGTYSCDPISTYELVTAYRTSWMARAVVDIPAQDATRKWRSWQAEADQIDKIEKLEKSLGVQKKIEQLLIASRLFGGAAMYIGTNDADPSKPLNPARVREIRSLTVLSPEQITPGKINRDIDSTFYGCPEFYNLTSDGKPVTIHASRLVVLHGSPVPEQSFTFDAWGDSVLQSAWNALLQSDSTNANINSLIFEAKVDVFRFQGLIGLMGEQGGDQKVIKRMSAQALLKGINGAVVLDKEDEYEQKNASFSGLPDLMDRYNQNVSGASRIPVTRFFGRASAGLSGSGDGDERVYFDNIGHLQSTVVQPAMHTLDECLIWIALGSRPEEIYYRWNPLRQVTEKERADIFKTTADAARALAGSGAGEVIPIDALSDSVVNELVEQGVLPGLQSAIEEYGSLYEQSELGGIDVPAAEPDQDAPEGGGNEE